MAASEPRHPVPDAPPPRPPADALNSRWSWLALLGGWGLTASLTAGTELDWVSRPWELGVILVATWRLGAMSGGAVAVTAALWHAWWLQPTVAAPRIALAEGSVLAATGLLIFAVASQRQRWTRELYLARKDFLTQADNRQALFETLQAELERLARHHRTFALVYIDCDGFKALNDTEGHARGDLALIRLSDALRQQTRSFDTVARLGGDEFVVLLPDTDLAETEHLLERFRTGLDAVEREFPTLSVTAGVVVFRGAPSSIDECLRLADAAMYRAKARGSNQTEFQVYPSDPLTPAAPRVVLAE